MVEHRLECTSPRIQFRGDGDEKMNLTRVEEGSTSSLVVWSEGLDSEAKVCQYLNPTVTQIIFSAFPYK